MIKKLQEKLFFWCLEHEDSPLVETLNYNNFNYMAVEIYKFRFARFITIQGKKYN
jgi:hypothetical protein